MIKQILEFLECDKYKKLYLEEKDKYEELVFYVQQMNIQHEEILNLLKQKKELNCLKNKVAGVKFQK